MFKLLVALFLSSIYCVEWKSLEDCRNLDWSTVPKDQLQFLANYEFAVRVNDNGRRHGNMYQIDLKRQVEYYAEDYFSTLNVIRERYNVDNVTMTAAAIWNASQTLEGLQKLRDLHPMIEHATWYKLRRENIICPRASSKAAAELARRNLCVDCLRPLVVVGNSRANGRRHNDWSSRLLHKRCWKSLMNEYEDE
jgi:hypothetical protein